MKKILNQIKWWEILIIYLILLFIFRYITFFPILKMVEGKHGTFNDFLIYNYLVNCILFILKIILFPLLIVLGNTLWGIKAKHSSLLKSIVLGQFIYLFRFVSIIFYIYLENHSTDFDTPWHNSKLNFSFVFHLQNNGVMYDILNFISVYDILFIFLTALTYSAEANIKPNKTLKVTCASLLPIYIIYPLIFVFLKTM